MRKIRSLLFSFLAVLLTFSPYLVRAQWIPARYEESNLPAGSIYDIIRVLMLWILAIFGFIGIIGFVISGIMYLTAAGNEDQIGKAKSAMKWSLVGVVVGLLGLVILLAVSRLLYPGAYWGYF